VGRFFARIYPVRWLATLLLIFVIDICTYLALIQSPGPHVINNQDKVLHALAFFILTLIGHISLHFDLFPRFKNTWWLMAINVGVWASYGLAIEILQGFTGYRSASMADYYADLLGIFLGLIVAIACGLHPQPLPQEEHP
jgi:VanZ family protein